MNESHTMLCKMNMHDQYTKEFSDTDTLKILRVPGGWIYTRIDQRSTTSVFVPWNDKE